MDFGNHCTASCDLGTNWTILIVILLSLAFIIFALYACLVVASDCDDAMEERMTEIIKALYMSAYIVAVVGFILLIWAERRKEE